MPSYATGRMTWPRPVEAPLFWRGDYSDIRERVRRTGRLDTDQLWDDTDSGDGYKAFWHRHGHVLLIEGYEREQLKANARNKARALAQYERRQQALAEVEARRTARLEAERQRRLEEQALADAEWTRTEAEKAAAIAWWSEIDPKYASEKYYPCKFGQPMRFGSVDLEPDKGYWLPKPVRRALLKELGH